ncbi:MAG: hypothetical protein Q8N99_00755 [Nanoarchaeota archaeon]|nr:hypothetical protein [Nanoarchaeota archaeon]
MGKHEHSKESSFILGIGPTIHTETIKESDREYKGYGWSRSEAERNAESNRSSGNSSSSGSSGGGSSGGGGDSCCYVTTACLDAIGLPRDSLEFRAMKILTKEHILKSFSGKRDYVLYQKKGPAIVQAIESREDAQNIWRSVYEKLRNVAASILSKNYGKGHQQYKELILGLEEQFVRDR